MYRIIASSLIAIGLLSLVGCKHEQVVNSEIVLKYRDAGGGDPGGTTRDQMGVWLGKKEQEGVRKELTPLSKARQNQNPPADWTNSDEGQICTGVVQANFFAPSEINRKGTAF
jgi:hypothetical protein